MALDKFIVLKSITINQSKTQLTETKTKPGLKKIKKVKNLGDLVDPVTR